MAVSEIRNWAFGIIMADRTGILTFCDNLTGFLFKLMSCYSIELGNVYC